MADGEDADDENEQRPSTAIDRPWTGTGGTHRSSERPATATTAIYRPRTAERPTTAVYAPQVAKVVTPGIVTVPNGGEKAAISRPPAEPEQRDQQVVGRELAATLKPPMNGSQHVEPSVSSAGYEADKSSMDSSNWQAKEGPPVCNGCGRLFCMGKMACCRQGDGTPGWKRWAPEK